MLGMPTPPVSPRGVGNLRGDQQFPTAARTALANPQLRANLSHATATIRTKRAEVVAEVPGWEALREAGRS
jgi:L-lactate dehydrogenase complex protein LldF